MCGICGMIGPAFNNADLGMMQDLAYISGLRGLDGAGVLQGRIKPNLRKKSYKIIKSRNEISYLTWYHTKGGGDKQADKSVLNNTLDNFMIVHTRHATVGADTDENAHPFDLTNLIGLHNGTLVDKKYKSETKTDSEMMFADMDERGIAPVLSELDNKSAYAIVVFDKRTNHFTIGRNIERPLWIVSNKERKVAYIASEARFLACAAGRNGVKLGSFEVLEPGYLYTFNPFDIETNGLPDWDKVSIKRDFASRMSFVQGPSEPVRNNVLQLGDRRRTVEPVRFDDETCQECRRSMNLLDQMRGIEYERGKWMCEECDDKAYKKAQAARKELEEQKKLEQDNDKGRIIH